MSQQNEAGTEQQSPPQDERTSFAAIGKRLGMTAEEAEEAYNTALHKLRVALVDNPEEGAAKVELNALGRDLRKGIDEALASEAEGTAEPPKLSHIVWEKPSGPGIIITGAPVPKK